MLQGPAVPYFFLNNPANMLILVQDGFSNHKKFIVDKFIFSNNLCSLRWIQRSRACCFASTPADVHIRKYSGLNMKVRMITI